MKVRNRTVAVMVAVCFCMALVSFAVPARAQEKTPAELAAETVAYCKSTAKTRPTPPSVIVDKVDQASALIEKEGAAAFPKFRGKGSEFLFEGTYIWIHTLEAGEMLMHPINYKMEGKTYYGLKDKRGKRFFAAMNDVAKKEGAGWISYWWPKPGTKEIVEKISYVKKCKSADGVDLVLGCGIYNPSKEDLAKLDIR